MTLEQIGALTLDQARFELGGAAQARPQVDAREAERRAQFALFDAIACRFGLAAGDFSDPDPAVLARYVTLALGPTSINPAVLASAAKAYAAHKSAEPE